MTAAEPHHRFDWGVAARPLAGEQESGDLHVVCPFEGGALVAVIDALGHGAPAAAVARRAAATLEARAGQPIDRIVRHCHDALQGTRGVVLSIASIQIDDSTMEFLGVGNIETLLVAADAGGAGRATLLTRRGVVGGGLPVLRPLTVPLAAGDTLCFATDGVDPRFTSDRPQRLPPQQMAETILARYGKSSDDALVLVVRILELPRR